MSIYVYTTIDKFPGMVGDYIKDALSRGNTAVLTDDGERVRIEMVPYALIEAAPDLLKATELAVQNFERQNLHPEVNFLGDDDHEVWTALAAAIRKAKGGTS